MPWDDRKESRCCSSKIECLKAGCIVLNRMISDEVLMLKPNSNLFVWPPSPSGEG